jgi:magnesium transporter
MTPDVHEELNPQPWDKLKEIVSSNDSAQLFVYLSTLSSAETARAISRLSHEEQTALLTLLTPQEAAHIIEEVPGAQAVELIADLPPAEAAAIVDEMHSDLQADLLGELKTENAEAILDEMPLQAAEDARQLLTYPPDTAGGVMITEYLAYPEQLRVADVLDDLREHGERYSDYNVQYAYVTKADGTLVGVLPLRELLLARRAQPITNLMIANPLFVGLDTSLDKLKQFFDQHTFFGVPVVDETNRLVGVARRAAVKEAVNKRSNKVFLKFSGIIGGEELRSMRLFSRSFRRLSWLTINIFLNIIAASVIAIYQDTLEKAITLAIFLPIISDMSGCSGNQAVAVSIRELTLGLVRPRELLRVFLKESTVGLINGLILGCLLGGVALLWKGNPYLGLVVGTALAANTLVSVSLGGLLPLLLKRLKMDPALVSGPALTTVTDMCGFFFVLSFASFLLPKLTV